MTAVRTGSVSVASTGAGATCGVMGFRSLLTRLRCVGCRVLVVLLSVDVALVLVEFVGVEFVGEVQNERDQTLVVRRCAQPRFG
ncbi:hypothetical protein ACH46_00055 [Gordonia phthalatica]|uniref:Uncharacterized protein n=1 Tax=Gordonia phthalatica TaxID=1136941 RepID=A0A0N9N632_9ACTN|nr:hypothetical protein ACH46_00055 [Gordonia phthalatica]